MGAIISYVYDIWHNSAALWPEWVCNEELCMCVLYTQHDSTGLHRCGPDFLSIGPHQMEQLTLFLSWNTILPLSSYTKGDIRSNRCLILVNLPLNNKVTSLHMIERRPSPQNPGYGFLKVPLHCSSLCLCLVKNQGIKSDFHPKIFPCSSFKYISERGSCKPRGVNK